MRGFGALFLVGFGDFGGCADAFELQAAGDCGSVVVRRHCSRLGENWEGEVGRSLLGGSTTVNLAIRVGLKSGVKTCSCWRQAFHLHFHMKTSRIVRDTAKVAISFSQADYAPRRQTRAFAASLQAFTANSDVPIPSPEKKGVKYEDTSDDSSLSSPSSIFDIEDAPFESSISRKRKRGVDSPSTVVTAQSTSTSTRASPRKLNVKSEDGTIGKLKKAKRQPAKRIVNDAGEVETEAPANWEEIYDAVREMRKKKLAPVDTMGCETLAEEHLTPRVSWS